MAFFSGLEARTPRVDPAIRDKPALLQDLKDKFLIHGVIQAFIRGSIVDDIPDPGCGEVFDALQACMNRQLHVAYWDSVDAYEVTFRDLVPDDQIVYFDDDDDDDDNAENNQTAVVVSPVAPTPLSSASLPSATHRIPRPMNCFILYRHYEYERLKAQCPHLTVQMISKLVSKSWHDGGEPLHVVWKERARIVKAEHEAMYPNYRFSPRKPGEKRKRARASRKSTVKGAAKKSVEVPTIAPTMDIGAAIQATVVQKPLPDFSVADGIYAGMVPMENTQRHINGLARSNGLDDAGNDFNEFVQWTLPINQD